MILILHFNYNLLDVKHDNGVQIGNDIAESLPGNTEIQDILIEASKLSHGEIIKPQIQIILL